MFKQYSFDGFRVDAGNCNLYFENELVKNINKKSLQVLIVLLEKPKQVVSHEEIIARVWGDNYHGVTGNNVAQYILRLRKILAEYQPEKNFIGTKHGYIFLEDVVTGNETIKLDNRQNLAADSTKDYLPLPVLTPDDSSPKNVSFPTRKDYHLKLLIPFSILILVVVFIAVRYFSATDEEQVKQSIENSQKYESLVLYENPADFNENELRKYWIDEQNAGDLDIIKVRNGVKNLIQKGIYYGKESNCEKFDFVSVDVNETKDFAVAKTIEKWFVAKYRTDGTLFENKTIGPYSIIYNLRKINGKWLIEKSSTARAGS
ncbi:MAG: winged helix-turn-helix domain-containing protein [Pyrinomonadaceae bacterium]